MGGEAQSAIELKVMPDAATYRELLALSPPDFPLDPKTEGVFEADGLVIERISFAVSSNERTPGYFARPKNADGPLPAVVALHCHGGFYAYGKEKIIPGPSDAASVAAYRGELYAGQAYGVELAKRGFCVLAIDCHYFGERRRDDLVPPETWESIEAAGGVGSLEGASILNQRFIAAEHLVQKELLAVGKIWPGVILAEDIRSVDYLLTRPEVDSHRIGCIGLSLGGFRSAALAGMDSRIQAAVVIGWMTDFADLGFVYANRHTWMVHVPRMTSHGDLTGLTSLHAPKPLLVQQCAHDNLFPLDGMERACRRLAENYEAAGSPQMFEGRFYDCPHEFSVPMQAEAFDWLERHLGTE
jgi:dienelactone hydrolase